MAGRPWQPFEDEVIRQQYGKVHPGIIGQRIGRTRGAVTKRAADLGLSFSRKAEFGHEFDVFMREKHKAGWSDTEIAREWGADAGYVSRLRKAAGLPCNKFNARHRAKLKAHAKKVAQECGVKNLGQVRALSLRLSLHQQGYPDGIGPRQARIIDQLRIRPMTRRMLCEAMGLKFNSRCLLYKDKSLLHGLVKMGIVRRARVGGQIEGQGAGEFVYYLVQAKAGRAA